MKSTNNENRITVSLFDDLILDGVLELILNVWSIYYIVYYSYFNKNSKIAVLELFCIGKQS